MDVVCGYGFVTFCSAHQLAHQRAEDAYQPSNRQHLSPSIHETTGLARQDGEVLATMT